MRKMLRFLPFLFLLAVLAGWVFPAAAQGTANEFELRLRRDFGYSSGGGQIQGTFTMRTRGPENLSRVVFYLDEQILGEVTQAPFDLRFTTDQYSQGLHTLYAVGFTSDGRELRSNEIRTQFVSAEEGWQAGLAIAGPVLGITLAAVLLSTLSIFLTSGKLKDLPPGAPRTYGLMGGAICPKCHRPFGVHFLSMNIVVGKLDRCPFCGKWSIIRRSSLEALRAAEAAELEDARNSGLASTQSEDEKLRQQLDESRYQDG